MRTGKIPAPPSGKIEYDFCQGRVRISARAVSESPDGCWYELRRFEVGGETRVLMTAASWPEIWLTGRSLAEMESAGALLRSSLDFWQQGTKALR